RPLWSGVGSCLFDNGLDRMNEIAIFLYPLDLGGRFVDEGIANDFGDALSVVVKVLHQQGDHLVIPYHTEFFNGMHVEKGRMSDAMVAVELVSDSGVQRFKEFRNPDFLHDLRIIAAYHIRVRL